MDKKVGHIAGVAGSGGAFENVLSVLYERGYMKGKKEMSTPCIQNCRSVIVEHSSLAFLCDMVPCEVLQKKSHLR